MTDNYEDARMMIELARWGTEMGLEDALAALFQDSFDPASAADDDPNVRKVTWFFELVGTLVHRGVLSGDFVNDVWWTAGMWPLVEFHVLKAREGSGEPRLYEHFESLAKLLAA
jgi:hypothetical protein